MTNRITLSQARAAGRRFSKAYYDLAQRTWAGNTYWLGVPVKKLPLDLWVLQEIIAETRPDLIVETGTSKGGSALFFATVLQAAGGGEVVTVDIDTSRVRRLAASHPSITVLHGSSTDRVVRREVRRRARGRRVMVTLDSDHRAQHVLSELNAYSPLVSKGCYLVVEDTNVGGHPVLPRHGAGPWEALREWLPAHPDFAVDRRREKFLATFNPGGYLRRVARAGR